MLGKYTYTAFGAVNASSDTQANVNPYRYATGYTDDHTSLTKIGARYYDPTQGRFTQPDPSGQETNPYLYASAAPTTLNDPSGLWPWDGCSWDSWTCYPDDPWEEEQEMTWGCFWTLTSVGVAVFAPMTWPEIIVGANLATGSYFSSC